VVSTADEVLKRIMRHPWIGVAAQQLADSVNQHVMQELTMRSKIDIGHISIDSVKSSYENALRIGPALPAFFDPVTFWASLPLVPPHYICEPWGTNALMSGPAMLSCAWHLLHYKEAQDAYKDAIGHRGAWILCQPPAMCQPCEWCKRAESNGYPKLAPHSID
jgi:hypothetical protein